LGIAITDDHRQLAEVVRAFLDRHGARASARALLDAPREDKPKLWSELAELGWLGIHIPERFGGSGYGLPELVVIAEEFGRAVVPGPFLPTVVTSGLLAGRADGQPQAQLLPGLVDGSLTAAIGFGATLAVADGNVSGDGGVVLGADHASVLTLLSGRDVVLVDATDPGVSIDMSANLDLTRRSGHVTLHDVKASSSTFLPGAAADALALARAIAAAECVGGALDCLDAALAYAKVREQFGRTIGTYQAIKHHLADMLVAAEAGVATVWDAARAYGAPGEAFALMAACAATVAIPAYVANAEMNIHIHGGIGYTWEHDAHLHLRRAAAFRGLLGGDGPGMDVHRLSTGGTSRRNSIDLPEHAETLRKQIRADIAGWDRVEPANLRDKLIETGYLVPHWPKPWGRAADAVEQLVIEEELAAAGIKRPDLSISGWVILTLIQHGTAELVQRFVTPALRGEEIWCQLFSEPGAGSDAAAVRTKATRVDGGWLISGQKVWTSLAHQCHLGLATVRTDPNAAKHAGITTMIVDMTAEGVEVRPLRQITGGAEFNEVFLSDVFVSDAYVVGEPHQGWKVARATLGNERVTIGGRGDDRDIQDLIRLAATYGPVSDEGSARIGRCIADSHAQRLLNLRRAARSIAGGEPGPEGNVTKLLLSQHVAHRTTLCAELLGPAGVLADGPAARTAEMVLATPAYAIAGGTSEITRNQIAERILGLPRDPLIS
jgi:3-oxochol-4-en-24-oyl-CoA dehydrogenase